MSGLPLSSLFQKDNPCWYRWRWQVSNRLSSSEELLALLNLSEPQDEILSVLERYPWASTPYYLSLIDFSDPDDPVSRQVLPSPLELSFSLPGSCADPLSEDAHSPCPGLVHRYHDRVLVITTGFCFSYCRHCNRKRNWKRDVKVPSGKRLEKMCSYIAAHPEIREVILSGGDPLSLGIEMLDRLLHAFRKISTVEVLRIGTRVPVVLPMRITEELTSMLSSHRPLWINIHFNHPAEITDESAAACDRLLMAGIPVSNHTVLLKGVNDDFHTLHRLFTKLNRIMVRPYYLFHCDAARGTDHFRTSVETGVRIMSRLYARTGGLCLPQYVVDLPNGGGKAPVMQSYLLGVEGNTAVFRTSQGKIMKYHAFHGAESTDRGFF